MDERPDRISEILDPRKSVVPANQQRAAAYVRMSTEHQRYSIRHQMNAIGAYAEAHGLKIVHVYQDAGKSGLSLKGRHGLLELLSDVIDGTDRYSAILVQDVSRWGRFQDADEAAYYEHVCKRAGYQIHYCMEQFVNNDSAVSSIMKAVKRAMAGEYSRELSKKVYAAHCTLAKQGYRQAGSAGYGLRRMVVDEAGNFKGILEHGERKFIRSYRTILVKGPPHEVRTVRRIFREFIKNQGGEKKIADRLNEDGIRNDWGRPWIGTTIRRLLQSEKYTGVNVYNQTAFKMRKQRIMNAAEDWIRKADAFDPIIDKATFDAAQEIFQARANRYPRELLLSQLRKLHKKRGYLDQKLIKADPDTPCMSTYYSRFGSIVRAYELIGYDKNHDFNYLRYRPLTQEIKRRTISEIGAGFEAIGVDASFDDRTGLYRVKSGFTVGVMVAPRRDNRFGSPCWIFNLAFTERPDIAVGVRMDLLNEAVLDYYVLPAKHFEHNSLTLKRGNRLAVDAFRCSNLDALYLLAAERRLDEIALNIAGEMPKVSEPKKPDTWPQMRIRRNLTTRAKVILKSFNATTGRIRNLIENGRSAHRKSSQIAGTLATLMKDENFANLLRAERIETMPAILADKIERDSDRGA